MPDTLAPFGWRLPLKADFFKNGYQAVRDLATDIAATVTANANRLTALESKPRAQLYQATAQSNLAAGWQTITLDSETHDTNGGHAQGAAGYTIPAGQAGDWWVTGSVAVTGVTGIFAIRLAVNGAVVPNIGHGDYETTSGGQQRSVPPRLLTLAVGDVVTLQAQVTGATWSTSVALTAGSTSQMQIWKA